MGASTGSGIQRRDARLREAGGRGRLIIDDDGDLVFTEAARRGVKSFLEQRLDPLAGTGVKSVAWCIMWGIAVGKGQTTYWETQQTGRPLSSAMPDPTPVMVEAARRAGMEIFGSIRMNDTHDAFGKPHGRLVYPLKVEHPEWLLGDESQRGDFLKTPEALTWSGLDYAVPQVREDRLWWVRHTAESYDLDGVDLNFFRMPWFFKPGAALRRQAEVLHREQPTEEPEGNPFPKRRWYEGTADICADSLSGYSTLLDDVASIGQATGQAL